MTEPDSIELCDRCQRTFNGDFCSDCGRPKTLKRIDRNYIVSEIGSVLNFDKGILFTFKELLIRPGQNIRNFIHKDRSRLIKPIVFVIVCSLIYTFLQQTVEFEDGYVNYSFDSNDTITAIFDWLTNNYGYTNILMSIPIALWIKILYRKHNYNFFEILILLCFVIGMGMLIFSFFGVVQSLVAFEIIGKGFFLGVLYISWGIGQFFEGHKLLNSLKGFLSYMLGLISFTIIILVLGSAIEWILN